MCSAIDILVVCVGVVTAIIGIVAIFFGINIFKLERGVNANIKCIKNDLDRILTDLNKQKKRTDNLVNEFDEFREDVSSDIYYGMDGIGGYSLFMDSLIRFTLPYKPVRQMALKNILTSIYAASCKDNNFEKARRFISKFYNLIVAIESKSSGDGLGGYEIFDEKLNDSFIDLLSDAEECLGNDKDYVELLSFGIIDKLKYIKKALKKSAYHSKANNADENKDGDNDQVD